MARIAGAQALHEASKSHFQYAIECLNPTVFHWCEDLLACMKHQLTKCKRGNMKQFGFRSILVTFILERVPLFWYQWLEVDPPTPRDPHFLRWGELMPQHGGGQQMSFPPTFFGWLCQQLTMVDDWAYAWTDF